MHGLRPGSCQGLCCGAYEARGRAQQPALTLVRILISVKTVDYRALAGGLILRYRDFRHAGRFARLGLRRFTVRHDGQRFVYYAERKDRGGPPLVLLHGFLDRGFAFRHVVASLMQDFRLIVVDLPGHGGSAMPPIRELWRGPAIYRSLYRFLRSLCNGPFHLLTHSMGGLLALQMHLYAGRHESGLSSLVAVAPGALLPSREELERLRRRFFPHSTEEVQQLLLELHHGLNQRVEDLPESLLRGLLHRWSSPGFVYLAENTMERPDEVFLTESQLQQCDLPVTLIWGSEDRIIPVSQGRTIAEALGADLHVVEGVGHNMLSERPEEVIRLTRQHFETHRAGQA